MSEENNIYYLKYLKYKKKYLDLVGGKKHKSGHSHHHHSSRHGSNPTFIPTSANSGYFFNGPQNMGLTSSPIIPILTVSPSSSPTFITSKPNIVSSGTNTFVPIPSLTPNTVVSSRSSSPNLLLRPASPTFGLASSIGLASPSIGLLGPSIVRIGATNDYSEFDTAFDTVNKRFSRDEFLIKFNLNYKTYPVKSYKNKTINEFIQEKNNIETTLRNKNIINSGIAIMTYDILMTNLVNLRVPNVYEQLDLQNLIKKYIVIDQIINILQ